jgi:hypothetical protein
MAKTKKTTTSDSAGAGDGGPIAVWTQRARGVGLLIGFAVTFLVSHGEGLPLADSVLRGVLGAFAMSLVAWWCALMVIRALMRSAVARQNDDVRAAAEAAATQEAGPS